MLICKIILISTILIPRILFGQDTVVYKGFLKETFPIETIELYPDSTFKWTNEFDISWDEYGKYELKNNQLILDSYLIALYPSSMSLKDSISFLSKVIDRKIYDIENERIYPLDDKGKRIIKFKHPYYKKKRQWIWGNKHEYIILKR
jgi:hypothetical protein